jgi:hypothetical protein
MSQYSGFISNFNSSLPTNGATDILSTVVTGGTFTPGASGSSEQSDVVSYIYLGNLLIQFSNQPINMQNSSTGVLSYAIQFGTLYSVVATPINITASSSDPPPTGAYASALSSNTELTNFWIAIQNATSLNGMSFTFIAIGTPST